MSLSTTPNDGPTTFFCADPAVVSIYNHDDNYFDLVLVAGWPLLTNTDDVKSYEEFIQLVKTCFNSEDLEGNHPTAYFYKPDYLHVTIATLYPLETEKPKDFEQIKQYFANLVQKASLRKQWPNKSLQLQIDSTQLGSKAGILLWREITGGLAKMRDSLMAEEMDEVQTQWKIHCIPGIIHTTFLRFSREPKTSGFVLQGLYQSKVVPAVQRIFLRLISVPTVHLVCETTPYMHIPKDNDHLFWSTNLSPA